jgi:hypothetical protein
MAMKKLKLKRKDNVNLAVAVALISAQTDKNEYAFGDISTNPKTVPSQSDFPINHFLGVCGGTYL